MADMGMVEKVARAICRAIVEKDSAEAQFAFEGAPASPETARYSSLQIDIEGEIRESWQEYIPIARAAIEAMREPTKEMLEAVIDGTSPYVAGPLYTAMIDAILKEEENG